MSLYERPHILMTPEQARELLGVETPPGAVALRYYHRNVERDPEWLYPHDLERLAIKARRSRAREQWRAAGIICLVLVIVCALLDTFVAAVAPLIAIQLVCLVIIATSVVKIWRA